MTKRDRQISRRGILVRASLVAGGVFAARVAHGEEKPARTIGLGFSLYGMRALTVDAALDALRQIGYDCVELPGMKDWPADSAQFDSSARRRLHDQLEERGLRL